MPILEVWGLPTWTSETTLVQLRAEVTNAVVKEMGCQPDWVSVFFPQDMLFVEGEGGDIFVYVNTAMLEEKADAAEVGATLCKELAQAVSKVFGGRRGVECFIVPLTRKWVFHLHAKA